MSSALETSEQLISRVRDCNDAAAWNRFFHAYEPLVMAICRKHGLQQADASDVTQDVFAAVAKAMPGFSYDAARGSFRSWLMKVTRSKLANYFHKRDWCVAALNCETIVQHPQRHERPKLECDESLNLKWNLFDRVTAEIQSEFRPTTWNAFWLTAMQEFSAEDVAAHLGISVQAVYIAKSRVLKRLRERVRELASDS